jgi:hypothetical protein
VTGAQGDGGDRSDDDAVAAAASLREEHARIVAERSGDPRFVQRRVRAGGVLELSWDPGSAVGAELSALFEAQREAFRARFGRDPGPVDPVFCDPQADVPTPLPDPVRRQWWGRVEDAMAQAGIDRAYARGAADVGYLVTGANRHLFTAMQVEAYLDAVQERYDQEAQDAVDVGGLVGQVPQLLRQAVAANLDVPSQAAARHGVDEVFAAAERLGCSLPGFGRIAAAMLTTLTAWMEGARTGGADPGALRDWLVDHLGGQEGIGAFRLWEALGDPGMTVSDAAQRWGVDLLSGLLHVTTAVVAVTGNGDPDWLTRNDPAL